MLALAISFVSITLEVIATTNEMFFGGKFLNGFAVGTLKAVSATYIGEVWPPWLLRDPRASAWCYSERN